MTDNSFTPNNSKQRISLQKKYPPPQSSSTQNPWSPLFQQCPYTQSLNDYMNARSTGGIVTTSQGMYFKNPYLWTTIVVCVSLTVFMFLWNYRPWYRLVRYTLIGLTLIIPMHIGIVFFIITKTKTATNVTVKFCLVLFAISLGAALMVTYISLRRFINYLF
ncbi:MAG: hypothetical protein LBE38_07115 [Deltaproteobacteria bacterium]|nr:hypothetical protein [Deltaproteobacteria bacterium]